MCGHFKGQNTRWILTVKSMVSIESDNVTQIDRGSDHTISTVSYIKQILTFSLCICNPIRLILPLNQSYHLEMMVMMTMMVLKYGS